MSDFNWYMPQDELSVHVGINHRISLIYQQKMIPSLIRLGKKHTRLFWWECGFPYIPRPGTKCRLGNIEWVPEKSCYCYKSRVLIPMRFNDPLIYGIAVEGVPKRKAPDFSDAF
jgi:hypothetical protein